MSLVVEGRFAEAEKSLREALRLDPTLAEGHYNLAVALKHTKAYFDDAIAEYHRALDGFADDPNRAKALYGIGLAREARGDAARGTSTRVRRPLRAEQPAVQIAEGHRDVINGVKVAGAYQKACALGATTQFRRCTVGG